MQQYIKVQRNTRAELLSLLNSMGTNIVFEEDVWVCDKLKQTDTDTANRYTLYFNNTPEEYKDWIRLYALKLVSNASKIKTIMNNITDIKTFFIFLKNEYGCIDVEQVDYIVMKKYQEYIDNYISEKTNKNISEDTKHAKWSSVSNFYLLFKNYEGGFAVTPVGKNVFEKKRKNKEKYIPKFVSDQLDDLMKDERIPVHFRTFYWIMRFFPCRLNEVVKLKVDFLKRVNDGWVLVLPMWKQNGGYKEPQIRTVRLKDGSAEGMYLIDTIQKQIEVSNSLQDNIKDESLKGYLFTARRHGYVKKGDGFYYRQYTDDKYIDVACDYSITKFMRSLCERFDIRQENEEIYRITSHMLRHTGITDRLSEGFEPIDIRKITDHANDAMIINNYDHTDDELLIEKQRAVLETEEDSETDAVFFNGKIMNLNPAVQKRLLRNIRAHKVKYGICSDMTDCGNNYECLDGCDYFVPDANDLPYFEEEVVQWQKKVEVYQKANNTFLLENAEHNLKLHQNVVNKIKKVIGSE